MRARICGIVSGMACSVYKSCFCNTISYLHKWRANAASFHQHLGRGSTARRMGGSRTPLNPKIKAVSKTTIAFHPRRLSTFFCGYPADGF